ncbi:MAG: AIPR family protein [Gammaproteobacteria bacterium]|nr:AIPR family protein [Gammaproteobacteria bacterium]
MNINASIIDQRVAGIIESHPEWFPGSDEGMHKSAAFVVLCMSTALDIPLEDCAEMLTEGGNDAGVDGLCFWDLDDGNFVVNLFQGKYKVKDLSGESHFPENGLKASLQTIEVLFDPNRNVTLNPKLQPLIDEIRSLIRDGYIPTVRLLLCNNGKQWADQADHWVQQAKSQFGDQLEVEHFNHDAIVRTLQRQPRIDEVLTLTGKMVAEDLNFKRVLVGRISVHELHRIFETHGDRLLDRNIRRYLGPANRINAEIFGTLTNQEESDNFYFYNNGITAICDHFDYNAMQMADYRVQLKNLQVINGGQTCRTIHQALEEDSSRGSNSFVLMRIYQVPSESKEIVREITRATNSQSPVDLRDLHSNDEIQKTLAMGIKNLGFTYKHHREGGAGGEDAVSSAQVAEAALAVWRELPHQAKFRRREHFGKLYNLIFNGLNQAQALSAVLLFQEAERRRRSRDEDAPDFIPYASHHLAMLMGRELLADLGIGLAELSHRHFEAVKAALQVDKDRYYKLATEKITSALRICYGDRQVSLQQLAGTFRRGDLMEMLSPTAGAS